MPSTADGATYHTDANNVIGTRGGDNTSHKIHVNYLVNKRGVPAASACYVCHKGGGAQESGHPANPTNKTFKSGGQPTAVPYLQVALDNGASGSILNVWNGVGTGPTYSGTRGGAADAANGWKTCSNTKCHYALSPSWSGKQQIGGVAFPATAYIVNIDNGASLGWGVTNMTPGAGKTGQNDNTLLTASGETITATYYGAPNTTERTAYNAIWFTALGAGSSTRITGVTFNIYLQKADSADRVRLLLQYFNPSDGAATTLYDTGLVDPGGAIGSTSLFTYASPTISAVAPDGMKLGMKVNFRQGSASSMRVYVATGTAGQNTRMTISGTNSTGVAPAPPRSTGDDAGIACNTCHQFGPDDATAGYKDDNQYYYDRPGSHAAHGVSVIAGNNPTADNALNTCTICHPAASNTYDSDHMDGAVDIRSGSIGTTTSSPGYGTYDPGTRVCSNVACHFQPTPPWGSSASCTSCHNNGTNDGNINNAWPNTGAHAPHAAQSPTGNGYACTRCHPDNTGGHSPIDGSTQVTFAGNFVPGGTYDTGNKTCSGTYCHGTPSTLPKWDNAATVQGCGVCHSENYSDPMGGGSYTSLHHPHATNIGTRPTDLRIACEVCHSRRSASHPNATHAGGDPFPGPQTAEVLFTDNAALQTYYTAPYPFFSRNMWANPYEAGATPTYVGGAQGAEPNWSMGTCSVLWCHSNGNPVGWLGVSGTNAYRPKIWDRNVLGNCAGCHTWWSQYSNPDYRANVPGYCARCHSGSATAAAMTGTDNLSGAHIKHVATDRYNYDCSECHAATVRDHTSDYLVVRSGMDNHVDGIKTVRFSNNFGWWIDQSGATYDNGTKRCNNLFCHGTAAKYYPPPFNNAPLQTLSWSSGPGSTCVSCHKSNAASGQPLDSGKHANHVNNASMIGTTVPCTQCHYMTVSADTVISDYGNHVDGMPTVFFSDTDVGYYNGDPEFSCANTTCHRQGNPSLPSSGDPYTYLPGQDNLIAYWQDIVWSSPCRGCHGSIAGGSVSGYTFSSRAGEPNYDNNIAPGVRNSHRSHVQPTDNTTVCARCHPDADTATPNRISNGSQHLDGSVEVQAGAGVSFAWTGSTHTCADISCHGGAGANAGWGAALNCSPCHVGSADVDDFGTGTASSMFNNGITARIDGNEWLYSGHGKPSGTYDVSLHPAAAFAGADPCLYCHDSNVVHDNTSNPFRLVNYNWGGLGWNGVCQICHRESPAPPGYAPSGYTLKNTQDNGSRVGTAHYSSKHSGTNNGGAFCYDCHDPHGDRNSTPSGNVFMIGKRVSMRTGTVENVGIPVNGNDNSFRPAPMFTDNATGTSYARSAAPFNGICQVCHTTTGHYTQTSGDGHNSGTRCTTCHPHDSNFESNCIDCHAPTGKLNSNAPTVFWPGGNRPSPPAGITQGAYGSHLIGTKADPAFGGGTNWNAQCNKCHTGHGGAVNVPLPPASWTDPSGRLSGTNMAQRLGLDIYSVDNGIRLGGTSTSGPTEADVCWNCHANVANNVSEWGFNTKTTPTGYPVVLNTSPGNFPTQHDGTSDRVNQGWIYTSGSYSITTPDWTSGYWMEEYDNTIRRRIASVHTVSFDPAGQSSSVAANVNADNTVNRASPTLENKSYIRCSYCHDVHELNRAQNDNTSGKPLLRGTWVGNPYPPELPPRSSYSYPTGTPRNVSTNRDRGGYFIDQNSGWPTDNPAMNTPALTAGLCTLCHATNVDTMKFYTGSSLWLSGMVNGHSNSTLGGTRNLSIARDLFSGNRGGCGMGNQMCVGGNVGTPAYEGCWYSPTGGCCVIMNDGWYGGVNPPNAGTCTGYDGDYANWYTVPPPNGIGGAKGPVSMAHKFTCSKCHSPHAAGLPALLTQNCIDTVLGTPPNSGQQDPRAVNCHRKTSATDGWHKLAPGQ
jgi:predicted CxxxxCH...CXXCH cytochrome family protein